MLHNYVKTLLMCQLKLLVLNLNSLEWSLLSKIKAHLFFCWASCHKMSQYFNLFCLHDRYLVNPFLWYSNFYNLFERKAWWSILLAEFHDEGPVFLIFCKEQNTLSFSKIKSLLLGKLQGLRNPTVTSVCINLNPPN